MSNRIAKITGNPGLLYTPIPDRIEHVENGLLPFNSPALLFYSTHSKCIYINAPWIEPNKSLGPWHRIECLGLSTVLDGNPSWRERIKSMYCRELRLLKAFVLLNP